MTLTLAIIAVTCVVSYLALERPALMERLIFWPPAIVRRKQYDRFVTHGFIHADLLHLLFNMLTLFFFGRIVEPLFMALIGPIGYGFFYLGGIVAAILPSYGKHRNDPGYRSLGASGAVSAVLFAAILLDPWMILTLFIVPMPAVVFGVAYLIYSYWADRNGRGNVNHSAHLWGAAYGVAVLLALQPRLLGAFFAQLANPRFF